MVFILNEGLRTAWPNLLQLVDSCLPGSEFEVGEVFFSGGQVGDDDCPGFESCQQRIGDGIAGEIEDDEILLLAQYPGVREDRPVLGIKIFVVTVDEGWRAFTEGDHPAVVVEDGVWLGQLLFGVDLLVVWVDYRPPLTVRGQTTISGPVALPGCSGV